MRAETRAKLRFAVASLAVYLFFIGSLLHVAASYSVDTPFGTIICSGDMAGQTAPDARHTDKTDCALCAQHDAAGLLPGQPLRLPQPVRHALDAPLRPTGNVAPAIAQAAWPAKPRAPPREVVSA